MQPGIARILRLPRWQSIAIWRPGLLRTATRSQQVGKTGWAATYPRARSVEAKHHRQRLIPRQLRPFREHGLDLLAQIVGQHLRLSLLGSLLR